jgi:hypothetical protein
MVNCVTTGDYSLYSDINQIMKFNSQSQTVNYITKDIYINDRYLVRQTTMDSFEFYLANNLVFLFQFTAFNGVTDSPSFDIVDYQQDHFMFFDQIGIKLVNIAYTGTINPSWSMQTYQSIQYKSMESINTMVACLYYSSSNYIDFFFPSNGYATSLYTASINNYVFPYDSIKKCYPKINSPLFYLIAVWKSKIQF